MQGRVTTMAANFQLFNIVLTSCLLIGEEPMVNFGNQGKLQISSSHLLADNWLICRLHAQCMISESNVELCSNSVPCDVFVNNVS